LPKKNVATHRPFDTSAKTSVDIQYNYSDPLLRATRDDARRQKHVAEADQGAEMVNWHPQPGFSVDIDPNGVVVEMDIRIECCDVKGVEDLQHGYIHPSTGRPLSTAPP